MFVCNACWTWTFFNSSVSRTFWVVNYVWSICQSFLTSQKGGMIYQRTTTTCCSFISEWKTYVDERNDSTADKKKDNYNGVSIVYSLISLQKRWMLFWTCLILATELKQIIMDWTFMILKGSLEIFMKLFLPFSVSWSDQIQIQNNH